MEAQYNTPIFYSSTKKGMIQPDLYEVMFSSAASHHVFCDKRWFSKLEHIDPVPLGPVSATGCGTVFLPLFDDDFNIVWLSLKNCMYVPNLGVNAVSIRALSKGGFTTSLSMGKPGKGFESQATLESEAWPAFILNLSAGNGIASIMPVDYGQAGNLPESGEPGVDLSALSAPLEIPEQIFLSYVRVLPGN